MYILFLKHVGSSLDLLRECVSPYKNVASRLIGL
jgi:hypothetical protein